LQTILNAFPAIPIAGNNLKFLFAREKWTATVNGENYLAGNIEVEETDGGYLLKLGQTHIWPGAVGKSVGRIARLIPGGGAASNVLNSASGLAGSVVGAVEMSGPLYVLEYITGPGAKLSFLRIEDMKDNAASAQAQPSTNREQSGAVPGASISAQPRVKPIAYSFMNLVFGLGSYLQGDIPGGAIVMGGYAAAIGLLVWELSMSGYDDGASTPGNFGVAVGIGTLAFGLIKPLVFKGNRRLASAIDNFDVALVSSEHSRNAVALRYTHHF
jgi:hypothetical protein